MIHNCDCLEWMKAQPEHSIDICVSSPPYNIGIAYNSYTDRRSDYLQWQHSVWKEVCRILKPSGHLFLNLQPTRKDPLMPFRIVDKCDWQIQNTFIWNKSTEIDGYVRGHGYAVTTSNHYIPSGWEYVFHLTQKGRTPIKLEHSGVPYQPQWAQANSKRTGRNWRPTTNSWFIPYETNGAKSNKQLPNGKKHPAVFPKAMVKKCLAVCGATCDSIVYDPFAGTGTVAMASLEYGCKSVGTEIDPEYAVFANQRLPQCD